MILITEEDFIVVFFIVIIQQQFAGVSGRSIVLVVVLVVLVPRERPPFEYFLLSSRDILHSFAFHSRALFTQAPVDSLQSAS